MTTSDWTALGMAAGYTLLTAMAVYYGYLAVHVNTFRNIKRFIVSITGIVGVIGAAVVFGQLARSPFHFYDSSTQAHLVAVVVWLVAVAVFVGVTRVTRD